MIQISAKKFLAGENKSTKDDLSAVKKRVTEIIDDVKINGDAACFKYTKQLDGCELSSFSLDTKKLSQAYASFNQADLEPYIIAKERIKQFHQATLKKSWFKTDEQNSTYGQIVTPIERVGLYIPGGRAVYPSTLLMTAVPAMLAGVKDIVVVTPPDSKGEVNKHLLACLYILVLNEIYTIGGAQAIAALAYGTKSIKKVDKIFGPGNNYVAEAKIQVFGDVGIDLPAGASEILIYYDDESIAENIVAADLIAQAEHDISTKIYLLSPNQKLLDKTIDSINRLTPKESRKNIIAQAMENAYAIHADSIDQAAQVINKIAPEHLQLLNNNDNIDRLILHAGAIFKGLYSSAVVGDYLAGPNHTLPTMGRARFLSGLSCDDFQKHSSFCNLSQTTFNQLAPRIIRFAESEQLFAHANAIRSRLD